MSETGAADDFPIDQLLHPEVFPHPVDHLRLLETHISWVVLTGKFAYKIKKPVKLDFVDYSTAKLRQHFCHHELELNRRFAAEIYLDVVPILDTPQGLRITDQPTTATDHPTPSPSSKQRQRPTHSESTPLAREDIVPVEYAVKMREFSQDAILSARIHHDELTPGAVDQFAKLIADFHLGLQPALPSCPFGNPGQIAKDALDNFSVLLQDLANDSRLKKLTQLQAWTRQQVQRLSQKFQRRKTDGWIRHGHGDLHLKNVVQIDGQVIPFDGIEFNESFQWIDVLSEMAFPVMDFAARGRPDLAWHLLNRYLEQTGDYVDLDILRFYLVYRAMIRAKVTWLNPRNHSGPDRDSNRPAQSSPPATDNRDDRTSHAQPWDKYLDAASRFAMPSDPGLTIMHGFSGSGKSTVALKLVEEQGGIRLRSDVERIRLTRQLNAVDKYSDSMNQHVYQRLLELSDSVLRAGFSTVVDAAFLFADQRKRFIELAKHLNVPFQIVSCDAPYDELMKRIRNRVDDPSEATTEVLEQQIAHHDPIRPEEADYIRSDQVTDGQAN